jgi:hypothetical protein
MPRRKTFGTHEIHADWWDNHELVIIKDLTSEDDDWISDKTSTMTVGEADMSMKWGTTRRLTLIRGIESWTFTDDHNRSIPFPPFKNDPKVIAARTEALAGLASEDSNFIYGELNKRNQPMSEVEQEKLLTSASPGLEVRAETSPLSS